MTKSTCTVGHGVQQSWIDDAALHDIDTPDIAPCGTYQFVECRFNLAVWVPLHTVPDQP